MAKKTLVEASLVAVDKWRAWNTSPKTDGFEWHTFEASMIELEAVVGGEVRRLRGQIAFAKRVKKMEGK